MFSCPTSVSSIFPRAGGRGIRLRHTVAHHLKGIDGGCLLLLGLLQLLARFLIVFVAHQLLVVQALHTGIVGLHLTQVDVGQTHAALSTRELSHIGNHLHLRNDLALLHHVARLFHQLGNDTADLGFHVHLVAGFYLARNDGGLLQVALSGCELRIDNLLGLALLPEEHEGSDENQCDNCCDNQFAVLFHIFWFF